MEQSSLRQFGYVLVMITALRQMPYDGLTGILHHEHKCHWLGHPVDVASRGIVSPRFDGNTPISRAVDEHICFKRQQPFARIRDDRLYPSQFGDSSRAADVEQHLNAFLFQLLVQIMPQTERIVLRPDRTFMIVRNRLLRQNFGNDLTINARHIADTHKYADVAQGAHPA
ncbi:hypothetical protein D3C73_1064630 [compost metagenome]